MTEQRTDILVVGGGLGGVAATLAALRLGKRVVLTEETDWLGGQLTTQAVPPDEHPWIEEVGCTASYRQLRDGIREYYRRAYPLRPEALSDAHLNPGQGNVSPLCHEPNVARAVIEELLAPHRATGRLSVLLEHVPISTEVEGDRVEAVVFRDKRRDKVHTVAASYIIDATELGDLLPLAGVEHIIGAESQADTGEPHALPGAANPLDQQSISWCFAVSYHPGEDHTIERPEDYGFWQGFQSKVWPAKQLSWTTPHPVSLEPETRPLFTGPTDTKAANDLWHYRRILYRKHYPNGLYPSDIVVVNWPQLDYCLGPIVGVSDEEKARHLRGAAQLSFSLLYWMQTEAPRHDGGHGYSGLKLRGDVTGTEHGLTKSPYIREGRRIKAQFTVTENHVGVTARGNQRGAEVFSDSVGIGSYRIDLHPSTAERNYVDVSNWPFQIPLGALIPERVENLLPANKNIGTTHITNGCYRLHPVEWNIGEVAGALAAHCLEQNLTPGQVRNDKRHLADFQTLLIEKVGVELEWPETIRYEPRMQLFGVVE